MSQSQSLLTQDKKLRDKASAVIHSEWWDKFVSLTKAHIMDTATLTPGIQQGIQLLEDKMKEMTDPEEPAKAPHIGLHHDLSVAHKGDKPETEKKD